MTAEPPQVGDVLDLQIGAVGHGGFCVARHDGRVVFVRHSLPGERVRAAVTEVGRRGRFLRADAVEVLSASPDRVDPPCPHSGPGGCGGCDWQHASLGAQRRLKADVVREQLVRLGGVDPAALSELVVEPVAGDSHGLGWRTRVRWAVDGAGRVGLRRHRSHDVVPVAHCPLVTAAVDATGVGARTWPGQRELVVVGSAAGDRLVVPDPPVPADASARADAVAGLPEDVAVAGVRGRGWVTERAAGRDWRVTGGGFWQVHPGAADALVTAVADSLEPRPGDHLVDLYSGVGLFAGALAPVLGPGGRVDAVEADDRAHADARRCLHDLATVRLHHAPVAAWLAHAAPRRCDLVVLDPPRSGAGDDVLRRLVRLRARRIAYVACDPAALGRDVATLRGLGWALAGLRALDLFPMTHHVECVATFEPE
ncbi:MAG: class I SAM-dependent RNA methyltransferase [Candidatus Nanopelagicales bacterium]